MRSKLTPSIGEERQVSVFLWLPKTLHPLSDERWQTRWLERAIIRQRYEDWYDGIDGGSYWVNVGWVENFETDIDDAVDNIILEHKILDIVGKA